MSTISAIMLAQLQEQMKREKENDRTRVHRQDK